MSGPRPNPSSADPARAWVQRVSAPPGPDGKQRQPRVYGHAKKECGKNVRELLGGIDAGKPLADRKTKFGTHLDRRLRLRESEGELKSLPSYREAIELSDVAGAHGSMEAIA